MANIIDNLNTLNTNLDNTKFKIAKNLKDKGVQALPSDKLDILADKIVDIPSGSCNLQELNVTENGTYTPQAGDIKGYNKVTVNVPNSGGGEINWNLIGYEGDNQLYNDGYKEAENIFNKNSYEPKMDEKFARTQGIIWCPKMRGDASKIETAVDMLGESSVEYFIAPESFFNDGIFHRTFCGCVNLKEIKQTDKQILKSLDPKKYTDKEWNEKFKDYVKIGCSENKLNGHKFSFCDMFAGCRNLTGNFYVELSIMSNNKYPVFTSDVMNPESNPSGIYFHRITDDMSFAKQDTFTSFSGTFQYTNVKKVFVVLPQLSVNPDGGKINMFTTFEGSNVEEVEFYGSRNKQDIYAPIRFASSELFSPFWNCPNLKRVIGTRYIDVSGNHLSGLVTNCPSLEEFELPNTNSASYRFAFYNCKSLKKIKAYSREPIILEEDSHMPTFENVPDEGVIELYEEAANNEMSWRESEFYRGLVERKRWKMINMEFGREV